MEFNINEKEKQKLKSFIVTGIVVLTFMVIIGLGIKFIPEAVTITTSANGIELPIHSIDTRNKALSFTFNIGKDIKNLENILRVLDTYNLKATFFVQGDFVNKHPTELVKLVEAGHDIGNHTVSYKDMTNMDIDTMSKEILYLHSKVEEVAGYDMTLLRVPYGHYNNNVIKTVNSLGYYPIQWNVDSKDWKNYGTKSMIETILKNEHLGSGSIVRFQIGSKYLEEALPYVIEELIREGYGIVPVSELLHTTEYYVDGEGKQIKR